MIDQRLAEWFGSGDTGISSKTIALWMSARVPYERHWGDGTPSDGADFGRCYRLLKAIPEWRGRIAEMAERGGKWPTLVKHWDEIELVYEQELSNQPGCKGATFKLMQHVEVEAYEAMGWTVEKYPDGSMSSACPPRTSTPAS